MVKTDSSLVSYYATPVPMSDLSRYAEHLKGLPTELPELVRMLQGLVVHIFWAERMGLKLDLERQAEVQLRPAWRRMQRLLELDDSPLTLERPLERRLVSNCRDFSLLLTALLRAQGKAARARCGFGTYFTPGHYEDHWMVEAWDGKRWRQVDSQLDAFQREVLRIDFDPLDMPEGKFITGDEAWKLCRAGKADPDLFGIFEYKGWDFVRGDLLRDRLALVRFEILPWDFWTALEKPLADSSEAAWQGCDALAAMQANDSTELSRLQDALQQGDWQPPADWAA